MFEVCVGAILTQNTTWQNAKKALIGLKSKNIFSPFALSTTPLRKICSAVRSSGYYNQKAWCLNVFSKYILSSCAASPGKFFLQPTNVCRNELLALKGIGPETADSMLLYAGAKRIFVVDAYTKRVGSRFGWFNPDFAIGVMTETSEAEDFSTQKVRAMCEHRANFLRQKKSGIVCRIQRPIANFGFNFSSYSEVQEFFENSLPKSVKIYNEFHALMVELCKRYCKKKPLCDLCVLKNICVKKVMS